MSTKLNPGAFDCYNSALPDEETFTLLARDTSAPKTVRFWAVQRQVEINAGKRPESDGVMVEEAYRCADKMETWRKANLDRWKQSQPQPLSSKPAPVPPRPNLAPGPWVHYKFGTVYELISVALDEDANKWMVVHRNRTTGNLFVRPAREWTEVIKTFAKDMPRFRQPDGETRRQD